ncbi:hypothetical protein ACLIMP_04240 [Novosphingobium aerophilum]|uniref:hypothetical protein n=1 Tax=Novosphingobium aerophilum TaxID=2839843 RepID=UPI003FCF5C41
MTKISLLPNADTVTGTELVPFVKDGAMVKAPLATVFGSRQLDAAATFDSALQSLIEGPLGEVHLAVNAKGEIVLVGNRNLTAELDGIVTKFAAVDNRLNDSAYAALPDGSPRFFCEDALGMLVGPNGEDVHRKVKLPDGTTQDQRRYNDMIEGLLYRSREFPILFSSNAQWPASIRGTTSYVRIPAFAVGKDKVLFVGEGRVGASSDAATRRVIARVLTFEQVRWIEQTIRTDPAVSFLTMLETLSATNPQFELLREADEVSALGYGFADPAPVYDPVADVWWLMAGRRIPQQIVGIYSDDNLLTWKGQADTPLALPISGENAKQMLTLGQDNLFCPAHGIATREGRLFYPIRGNQGLSLATLDRADTSETPHGTWKRSFTMPSADAALAGIPTSEQSICQLPEDAGRLMVNSRYADGLRYTIIYNAEGTQMLDHYPEPSLPDIVAAGAILTFDGGDGVPRVIVSNNQAPRVDETTSELRYNLTLSISYRLGAQGSWLNNGPLYRPSDVAYRDVLNRNDTNSDLARNTGYSDLGQLDDRILDFKEARGLFSNGNAGMHHAFFLSFHTVRSLLA